jgi:iron-sulfur cluster assembly accessory protein
MEIGVTETVTISERAARRIGEILKSEGEGAKLRISVEGGGCSGFQYKFDVEKTQADDDLVIARDSAVVLVDPSSVPFLAGSEVECVVPRHQSKCDGLLRLRDQLLHLI